MVSVDVARHLVIEVVGSGEWAEEAVCVESRGESTLDGAESDGEVCKQIFEELMKVAAAEAVADLPRRLQSLSARLQRGFRRRRIGPMRL